MNKLQKTWLILLSISSILFLIVGFVMFVIDNKYINGIQYLFTAIFFSLAIYLNQKKKIKLSNPEMNLGFILAVIGLNINLGIWILGIILFLSGFFKK